MALGSPAGTEPFRANPSTCYCALRFPLVETAKDGRQSIAVGVLSKGNFAGSGRSSSLFFVPVPVPVPVPDFGGGREVAAGGGTSPGTGTGTGTKKREEADYREIWMKSPPEALESNSRVPSPSRPIWTQWKTTWARSLTRSRVGRTQSGPA